MENPIFLIMALTPGIIGIAISKLLNGDTSPEPLDKGIIKYFLYSSSALLLTEMHGTFAEARELRKNPDAIIEVVRPLQKALTGNFVFTMNDFLYPALTAVVVALLWKLFLRDCIVYITNLILSLCKKNKIDLPGCAFEKLLADNKGHVVEVYFPDGRIVIGVVSEYNVNDNSITIKELPNGIDFASVKESEKNILILLETGVVIKEFSYETQEE